MTKQEKIQMQKKLITDFMNYFKDKKLNEEDRTLLKFMKETITMVFQLEIGEIG